jgi:uncharacterized protein (TIGR03083 family)
VHRYRRRVLTTIRQERLALVERLRDLPAEDWDRPSLCAGWRIRDVLAHLTTPYLVSVPAMAREFVRHRGVSRAMDAVAHRLADETPPDELLAVLEANAGTPFRPPGLPLNAPLTDAIAHNADIRWALGDPVADWSDDPTRVTPVLDFLTGPLALTGFVRPGRVRGLALVADDADWRHGRGAEVRGPGLLLALGILGRAPAIDQLTGEGVARLRA